MRKLLIMLLSALFLFQATAFAEGDISVIIDSARLETTIAPRIDNDRLMLPMRSVFESLGAQVTWFEADKIIFATKGDSFITLKIGLPVMSVQTIGSDKNISIPLDTAPYIYGEYTLVPVRAVAEALHAAVDWNGETRTVVITMPQEP